MPDAQKNKASGSLSGHGRWWLFLIGFLALGLTALLWVREIHEEESRALAIFKRQSNMIADEIEAQMNLYAQLLRSAAGVQMHSSKLTRDEWRRYVEALNLDRNFPGVSGLGLVKFVTENEKEAFAAAANEEWPGFKVFPDRNLPEHYINYFLEPERVYRAVGFDVASRPDRKAAAEQARDSGEIAISAKTTLITPEASGSDLLMYLPLYKGGVTPKSVEARRKALWGWVAIGVSIPQMMWPINERIGKIADMTIYDGMEKLPEAKLFSVDSQKNPYGAEHYRFDVQRLIGGRVWLIDFTSHAEFEDTVRSGRALIILAAGIVATFIMALTAWILLSSRAKAEREARLRSQELERERDYAHSLLSASPSAILTMDAEGFITRSNPAACLLAGVKPDSISGMPFQDIFVPASERQAFAWSMSSLKSGTGPLALEISHNRGDERRIINWTFSAVRQANMPVKLLIATGTDITKHRLTEEILKAERSLFVTGPVVVFRWRAEAGWPVEYVSQNASQFGCSPSALMSGELPYMHLIHPDDLGRVASETARMTSQGVEMFERKYRLVRPSDGETVWVDDRTLIERDQTGKPVYFLGYLIDVTEREKAEEDRRNTEARIARVLSTSSEGYWELDAEERTVAVNPALLKMLEIDEASIMGKSPRNFIASDWEEKMRAVMTERQASAHRRFEMAFRSASGRILHARVSATSLFDRLGHLSGSFGLLTDITLEKQAEEALKNEQGRLRMIVDSVPMSLVVSRIDEAVVVSANQAALQLFGFGSEDMTRHPSADFYVDPNDRVRFIDMLRQQGVVRDFEVQMKRRDKSAFWAMLSGRQITLDDAECVLIGCMDISELKQTEARLAGMAGDLARSNAELEQFAYVASHDLQEPLRMIASYVQLLERRYGAELTEDAKEYIAFAVDGAKRMQTLITDLLEFSRVTRKGMPFVSVPLDKVALDALANLAVAQKESNAEISVDPLPDVLGDRAQLLRLFQNLIGNAIKYRHPDRAPVIQVRSRRIGDRWEISVSDNGIGIAKEYYERIFIIFQRLHTRADYPGTGIGLALCKKIVERHGGEIHVESEEGEGAEFVFTLPVVETQP